jgi:hypothetical protein
VGQLPAAVSRDTVPVGDEVHGHQDSHVSQRGRDGEAPLQRRLQQRCLAFPRNAVDDGEPHAVAVTASELGVAQTVDNRACKLQRGQSSERRHLELRPALHHDDVLAAAIATTAANLAIGPI